MTPGPEATPNDADLAAPAPPQGARGASRWQWITRAIFAAASVAALVLTAWPVLHGDRHLAEALRQAALPACLLALVILVAVRHERRWAIPAARLARLLAEVRAGQAPLEELSALCDVPPELAAVVAQTRRLCHDLKSQRCVARELEGQIQHRVATRTGTLERQLGALREKASRDALTGLGNRGAFDKIFPEVVERARREGADLCVVMIDVDYFKALNDTLGHAAGDDLLRKIGQLLRGATREQDEAFRYGGDEFVLVLWRTTASAGRATSERVSRLVEDLARPYRLANGPRLSCGVATLADAPAADAADLLRTADEDLYRLKHARKAARAA